MVADIPMSSHPSVMMTGVNVTGSVITQTVKSISCYVHAISVGACKLQSTLGTLECES